MKKSELYRLSLFQKKQLFFLRNDKVDVDVIEKNCKEAFHNKTLPISQREIDQVVAVNLTDLLKVAEEINKNNIYKSRYPIPSRTPGAPIEIDGHYMRMIAYKLKEVKEILNSLFPEAHF